MPRIHILGASGSGTSTLGQALASALGVSWVDSDTLFWLPTEPPFSTRRPVDERQALLHSSLPATGHWVFSGSATQWGTPLEPFYDVIVFLRLDPLVRMQRIKQREVERYGRRILPGGDLAASSAEFLAWAASYDTGGLEHRSVASHEAWLSTQSAPVLRLDSEASTSSLVADVLACPWLAAARAD